MHPGFFAWLHRQRLQYAGDAAFEGAGHGGPWHGAARGGPFGRGHDCHGERWHAGPWHGHGPHGGDEPGAAFGVRRPLRFLSHKLDLTEEQVGQLAAILDRLKTERAQADVDYRRRTASLAEAFEAGAFDGGKVDVAHTEQAKSAERLRGTVKSALEQMHALLTDEQRKKFAYLLRAGVLSI
jgi:Spy/CpxP family protein refolding chaperone